MLPPSFSPDCSAGVSAFEGMGDGDPNRPLFQFYYDQAGVATIGKGHALLNPQGHQIKRAFVGDPVAQGAAEAAMQKLFGTDSITLQQANDLLAADLATFYKLLVPVLSSIPTTQSQLDAFGSFSFNVGVQAFNHSTLLARHRAGATVSINLDFKALELASQSGQMPSGIEGAFGAWSHTAGVWDLGLFRRRMAEAMIYRGDGAAKAISVGQAIK